MLEPARPFADLPTARLTDLGRTDAEVAVFGAPWGTPYPSESPPHSGDAPKAIREALAWYAVGRRQIDMDTGRPVMGTARAVDLGDVPVGPEGTGAGNRAAIRGAVQAIRARGVTPLMLGGDDSVPIPFIEGFFGSEVTILQVDAHLDWRDEVEGVTHGFSSTMRRVSEMGHVGRIVQVGARGPGSARAEELTAARDWGAVLVPMREVHRAGLGPAIDAIGEGSDVIVTIDADGLDPALCPGVVLPAFGGLGYQEMLDLIEGVASKARIVGATLVEYVPSRDPSGLGAQALGRIGCHLIDAMARSGRG